MSKSLKNTLLILAFVLIIGAIWYLESTKPAQVASTDIQVSIATPTATSTVASTTLDRSELIKNKADTYSRAKELADIKGYINSKQFKLSDYAGKKVILVDFWTYSCINCQRTIPYLNAWYKKYKDEGLVIVGVHTPEFEFEKDYGNVSKAVADLGIQYPVVLDSNRATWGAYENRYWPHEYLIDIDGFVVHDHVGEGGYAETEKAIQDALVERQQVLGLAGAVSTSTVNPSDVIELSQAGVQSPETYFGAWRNEYLANGKPQAFNSQNLTIPTTTEPNKLYLGGTWNFTGEYAENTSQTATILYTYAAKNMYFVASSKVGTKIKIFLDDAPAGEMLIQANKLYTLVNGKDCGEHTLRIEVEGPGLQAYTFTFG